MSLAGNKPWTLDLAFIRKSCAEIISPLNNDHYKIEWEISVLSANTIPISVVRCRMKGLGQAVDGYGASFFYRNSLTQAFCEAWERLWMFHMRQNKMSIDELIVNSNGFACGNSPAQAEANARSELIERAVFLTAWNLQCGWEPLKTTGILNHVLESFLKSYGWDLALYRLSEPRLGDVLCGFARRINGGILFDSMHKAAGQSLPEAQGKLLKTLVRDSLVYDQNTSSNFIFPNNGTPDSHKNFYRNQSNAAAFNFLYATENVNRKWTLELGSYEQIRLKTLIAIEGFPFVARAINHAWPQLSWGLDSINRGSNPWPHPLA